MVSLVVLYHGLWMVQDELLFPLLTPSWLADLFELRLPVRYYFFFKNNILLGGKRA